MRFSRRSGDQATTQGDDDARGGSMGLPFTPTPFFADKNRAFWRLQLVGWGGAALLRATTNIANGKPDQLVLTLIATVTGFSISLILSVVYGKLINRRPLVTWSVTALALAIAVVISATINGWTLTWTWPGGQRITSSWNASVTSSGATVTAEDVGWNGAVAAGQTASAWGFVASGTATAPAVTCTPA